MTVLRITTKSKESVNEFFIDTSLLNGEWLGVANRMKSNHYPGINQSSAKQYLCPLHATARPRKQFEN
ncbi:hypothetical protein [Collimonas pratensis]|uniref:hypothetical protein n=1 Tax=Collimonas pratensis TaxID=279113 RepID=UPI0012E8BBE0|nr:hypothetical protein [Collimonas pratensis]